MSNVDGKISNIEESLRDFSNSYSGRGNQDKWRIHYPNKSNYTKEEVERLTVKENNETSEGQSEDVTDAQKYSWGKESRDQPSPYWAETGYDVSTKRTDTSGNSIDHHTYNLEQNGYNHNGTEKQINDDTHIASKYSSEKRSSELDQPPQSSSKDTEEVYEYEHHDQEYSDDSNAEGPNIANQSDTGAIIENNQGGGKSSFINYGYDTTTFLFEEDVREG